MTARLLLSDRPYPPPHTLADDFLSFVRVLDWVGLRFVGHQPTVENDHDVLTMMFDSSYAKGGRAEKSYLIGTEILTSRFRNDDIASVLAVLTNIILLALIHRP